MVTARPQVQRNRSVGFRRSGLHGLSTLPRWSVRCAQQARPAELQPQMLVLVHALGAEAWSMDGVLWVVFPSLLEARDPRANLLPVHVPAVFELAG